MRIRLDLLTISFVRSLRDPAAIAVALIAILAASRADGQQLPPSPPASQALGIKYIRDSEEYATLARQVYRLAGEAVTRNARGGGASGNWAVVMDVDETTLDNSTYQLDRTAYGLPFESASWNAWVQRREAPLVPGVTGFVGLVRRAGGHIAWITNRDVVTTDATRDNLRQLGLWKDDDRLCPQKNPDHTKAQRRAEVVAGNGECAWPGKPMRIVALLGDQLGDFPDATEHIPGTGTDDAFGRTCFLLPNPMYGQWTSRVTRVAR